MLVLYHSANLSRSVMQRQIDSLQLSLWTSASVNCAESGRSRPPLSAFSEYSQCTTNWLIYCHGICVEAFQLSPEDGGRSACSSTRRSGTWYVFITSFNYFITFVFSSSLSDSRVQRLYRRHKKHFSRERKHGHVISQKKMEPALD